MAVSPAAIPRRLIVYLLAAGSSFCLAQKLPAAVDIHGNPLPEGAIARLGTTRLRALCDSIHFSPDGKKIIGIADGRMVRTWDGATGKLLHTRRLDTQTSSPSVTVSADGNTLLIVRGQQLELWDVPSGKRLNVRLPEAKLRFEGCLLSRDGRQVLLRETLKDAASAGFDYAPVLPRESQLVLWDTRRGKGRTLASGDEPALAIAADGRHFASAAAVWDEDGKLLWRHAGYEAERVAFTPDGRYLIAAPAWGQKGWRVWETQTGRPATHLHPPPERWVRTFAISPDGTQLLFPAFHGDDYVLWDLKAGRARQRWPGARQGGKVTFAPDGRSVVTGDTLLRRWDTATGKPLYADVFALGHTARVEHLFFTSDSKRLVSTAADNTVRIWDVPGGRLLHTLELGGVCWDAWTLTPDGTTLVGVDQNLRVCCWSVADGRQRQSFVLAEAARLGIHLRAQAIGVLPGGRTLVVSAHPHWAVPTALKYSFSFWDLETGRLQHWGRAPAEGYDFDGRVLSSDGMTAACAQGLIDTETGRLLLTPEGKVRMESGTPCLSAAGRLLAGQRGSGKAGLCIWETASGELLLHQPARFASCVTFSREGQRIAFAESARLAVWDLVAKKKIVERPALSFSSRCGAWVSANLAFAPDGKLLASGHPDGTILLWSVPPASPAREPTEQETAALWQELAEQDAARAHVALWRLQNAPRRSVPLLRRHFPPGQTLNEAERQKLIAALDSDQFEEREEASRRLRLLGRAVEGALRQALKESPGLEQRRRLARLLAQLKPLDRPKGEDLREVRAVAILEGIDSPEARGLLQEWANRAEGGWLSEEARRAVTRLKGAGASH